MKKEKIFFGIFFIFAAIFLLAAQLGFVEGVGFWSLIAAVFLVAIMIKSVMKRNFFGIFFPLAILGIIFSKQLRMESLVPWTLLGVAFLFSIGCSILFPPKIFKGIHIHGGKNHGENMVSHSDENVVNESISFGSSIKYINSDNFESANLEANFGDLKVYFDNAIMQKSEAHVYLNNSFANMELYIPKSWTVISNVSNAFGGLEEQGRTELDGLHKIYLHGDNSFGSVTIIYI